MTGARPWRAWRLWLVLGCALLTGPGWSSFSPAPPAGGPLEEQIRALWNLGKMARRRGALDDAQNRFQQALSLAGQTSPPSPAAASILNGLGNVALTRGDLALAEDYYLRSLSLKLKRAPESPAVATTLDNLGGVAQLRGDLDSAERYFNKSLRLHLRLAQGSSPGSPQVARSLSLLGALAEERGDLESAERYLRASQSLEEQTAVEEQTAGRTLAYLGDIALERGDLAAAETEYRRSLAMRRKFVPNKVGESLYDLAKLAVRRGDLATAESCLREALARDGKLSARTWPRALVLQTLANVLRRTGRLHQAARFADLSIEALESQIGKLGGSLEAKGRFRGQRGDVYRDALRLQVELEHPETAFQLLERFRARAFLALLAERDLKVPAGDPRTLTFEQVRAALDPGTVMLSWSIGQETSQLFIIAPGRPLRVERLGVGRQALEEEVGRFRRLIEDTRTRSSLGAEGLGWFSRRLYRELVEPAERWIAAGDRVVLVPDGPLHLLPFAALMRSDGRYLVEWKPLSTVLSGTVYAELRKQRRDPRPPSSWQWVAFGDPSFPPRLVHGRPEDIGDVRLRSASTRGLLSWRRLPQSRREVEAIAALFPVGRRRIYLDSEATEERAKAIGKDARIVHFATHGFVDDRSPFDSGLVLSIPDDPAAGRDNGLLQVWEIFAGVRLDADLVVLSGCETGSGEVRGGEGIIGLTRAFQYAGARAVLASLWRVEDLATAELMQRFYRHLRAGKPKDEALREAQLELIRHPLRIPDGRGGTAEDAAAPFFWAALQLAGDGR